jgi:hypothetical protein
MAQSVIFKQRGAMFLRRTVSLSWGNVGVAGCQKMGIRTISMTIAVAVDWLALLGGKQNYLDKNWHTVDNHSRASSCLP